jgi:hypothetical protein
MKKNGQQYPTLETIKKIQGIQSPRTREARDDDDISTLPEQIIFREAEFTEAKSRINDPRLLQR